MALIGAKSLLIYKDATSTELTKCSDIKLVIIRRITTTITGMIIRMTITLLIST